MLQTIVFISLFLLVYHYFLYPLLVVVLARLLGGSHRPGQSGEAGNHDLPRVTFLVAAYNESLVIDEKIRNTLDLDYPGDLLEIIVVADGSDDGTERIVEGYAGQGVISLHQPERRGKTAALNRGVEKASGEIVIFSDANNEFSKSAIRELVKHFRDEKVGGVCGIKQIKQASERESSTGDSVYWLYESRIKQAESDIATITNADGEIFAIRKELFEKVDESVINDDAEISYNLIKKGFRIVYERAACSYELASEKLVDDFHVKVRMVAGGFQTVALHASAIFKLTSWYSFSFISHKLLRYLAPVFMLLVLAGSLLGWQEPVFQLLLGAQVLFYGLACLGWYGLQRENMSRVLYVPFYFVAMNLAAFMGLLRYFSSSQSVNWRKAAR
jgi:biofilm PGA synthesis N-glycosyltransferase PgaC